MALGLFPQIEAVFEGKQMRDNLVYDFLKSGNGEIALMDKGDVYSIITLQHHSTIPDNKDYQASNAFCRIEKPVLVNGNKAILALDYEKGTLTRTMHTRRLFKQIIKGLKVNNSNSNIGGMF